MARSIGEPMEIRPTEWQGVYSDGSWLLTRNLNPGVSVYGESLHLEGGIEYRRWDVNRSKLAAYLKCGGRGWADGDAPAVLYLRRGEGEAVRPPSRHRRHASRTSTYDYPPAL